MATIQQTSSDAASEWERFSICLPHPYLTRYNAQSTDVGKVQSAYNAPDGLIKQAYRITCAPVPAPAVKTRAPFPLHNSALWFSSLLDGNDIPVADNTSWARARRCPLTTFGWSSVEPPTIAQVWLLIYSIFTVHHSEEAIRLAFVGTETALIRDELLAVGLAIVHPVPLNASPASESWVDLADREVILLRSSFWQGAGSPFGPKAAWIPSKVDSHRQPLHTFPIFPTTQTITTKFPNARVHTLHPIRPSKPTPGSIIYSRYIPHLDENFSMIALDYTNSEHLNLFHTWQNDPRVAAGWNETGTLEQHHKYLKDLHDDPHTLTMFACFNDVPFAYFEVYWAKVRIILIAKPSIFLQNTNKYTRRTILVLIM